MNLAALAFCAALLAGCFPKALGSRDAEGLNKLAAYYFQKKDYGKCAAAAKKAVEINPYQWQAHEWIEACARAVEARQGRTLALFYTGNTQGVFVASTGQPLGGIPRRAGLLSSLRERYPYSVTVDAGNMLSPRHDPLKRSILFPLLKRMNYDAVNMGEGEWALSPDSLGAWAGESGVAVVATNLASANPDGGEPGLLTLHQTEPGKKFLVSILGVLPPRGGKIPVSEEIASLHPLVERVREKSDAVILLASAPMEACRRYAAAIPGLDVIVCAASERPSDIPDTAGGTLIVSPGARGEYLGLLLLRFNPTRRRVGFEHRLFPLDESAPEDAGLSASLREFIVSPPATPVERGQTAPQLPLVSSKDVTLPRRSKTRIPALADSLARLALPDSLARDSAAVDSARKSMLENQAAFVESLAVIREQRRAREQGDTTSQIYLRNLSTGGTTRVSWNLRRNRRPVLNARRSALFYFADTVRRGRVESDLCVYTLSTGAHDRVAAARGGGVVSAGWAADGRSVYCVSLDSAGAGELFLKRPWKNVLYNLSRTPGLSEEEVAASPDGRNIAFTRRENGGAVLYLAGPSGERPVAAAAVKGDCFSPAFSGSGRYLAYLFNERGRGEGYGDLAMLELSTGRRDTLVRNNRVREFLFNGDNEIILVSGINYTDLNALDVQSGTMRKLIQRPVGKLVSERRPRLFQGKNGRLVLYFEVEENGRPSAAAADYVTGEAVPLPLEQGRFSLE